MSTSTLAIPSALPGGLEAGMGMHFGHCDIYTIVQIADVSVYYAGNYPTVGLAVQAFLDGKLPAFSTEFTCGGGNH